MNRFFLQMRKQSSHAFTLVEMLVAIAVLTLLVMLTAQLTNSATSTVSHSRKHMDADSQARMIFSRMALDFAGMVKRVDVDYSTFKSSNNPQSGNDRFAFYSEGVGYYSGDPSKFSGNDRATVSLVSYAVLRDAFTGRMGLQRLSKALGWDPDTGGTWRSMAYLPVRLMELWPNLFVDDADYTTVGDQVFRIEYSYLLKPSTSDPANPTDGRLSLTPWNAPHTSINGFKDVAGIVVTLAILDPTSQVIVDVSNTALASALPDAAEGSEVMASWVSAINSPGFAATARIPQAAASAVRVYQRCFYLNGK